MSQISSVRTSRDGDQFHYLWAARRCLLLLSPRSHLAAITIEGASPLEASVNDPNGDVFIDVGEYYGSEDIRTATKVRYVQLKHSTLRPDKAWTAGEIGNTLEAFANRLALLEESSGTEVAEKRFEFSFLSNRPIDSAFLQAVEACGQGTTASKIAVIKTLERVTGRAGEALSRLCRVLRLEGAQDNYWTQRQILQQEMSKDTCPTPTSILPHS